MLLFYKTYGKWYATVLSVASMLFRYIGIGLCVNEEILPGVIFVVLGLGGAFLADYLGKR